MNTAESVLDVTDLSYIRPSARRGQRLTLLHPESGSVEPVKRVPAETTPIAEVRRREGTYRRLLTIADATAAVGTFALATLVSGRSPSWLLFLPALFAVFVAKIQGLYDRDEVVIRKSSLNEWRQLLQSAAMTSVLVYLTWRLITNASHGGGVRLLVFLTLVSFGFDLVGRVLARRIARSVTPDERIIIIGEPKRCRQLARSLSELPGIDLIGTIPSGGLEGSTEELAAVTAHLHSHRLIIVPDHGQTEAVTLEMIRNAKGLGIRVSLMPSIMTVVGTRATFDEVHGLPLLGVPRFGLTRSSAALKRLLDLVGSAVGLAIALPLLAVLAVAIKLDTRGPVLFRQTRVGRDGRLFQILKLRTMVAGADQMKAALQESNEAEDGLFKMADDPRVTRVGRKLRALHLDELPQFVNVLLGDMSLVGPRPLVIEEDERLFRATSQRLLLTPGITGPWQIRGPMNASLSEMARLDYLYISGWSIWRDIDLIIRTGQRVLARGGH